MNLRKTFLTFFGSGLSSIAPGTVGTIASIPLGILVIHYLGVESLMTLVIVTSIIAVFEINKCEKKTKIHDAKWIVIDESVGIWLTMVIIYDGLSKLNTTSHINALILSSFIGFLLFRLFDIWKPSTIGYIDKKVKGGLGVVLDDILAGFAAGLLGLLIFHALNYYKVDINSIFSFL